MDTKWIEQMKKDWNERAKENAMHYIMTDKPQWSEADFYESGERDIAGFVDPFLTRYSIKSPGTLLELGCGIGRLTIALAKRFKQVDAVDVSAEMINIASEKFQNVKNISFMTNNGADLDCCKSDHYDMVFSYIVLQHIPDPEIIYGYFREFGRILKSGGFFLFQVSNNNWKGHLKYLEKWEARRKILQMENQIVKFDDYDHAYLESKIKNYETIVQTPVDLDRSIEILNQSNLFVDWKTGENTDILWLGGQKKS